MTCSRGVKIMADTTIAEAAKDTYDMIALPVSSRAARAGVCVCVCVCV